MSAVIVAGPAKVRKTLTLDADLIETFTEDDPESLSAAVNAVLRSEHERRLRRASIRQLADDLAVMYGPPDPVAVAEAKALLA